MTARVIVIPDATASTTRVNINDALAALGSTNSGATAPPDSLNNMLWYDTANHILKIKAETGADWINIGYLDQSTDTFKILDDTVVTTAAGVHTNGVIGDQLIGTWETGTGTTESLVSPAKVKASVIANAPSSSFTLGSFTSAAGNSYLDFSFPVTATEVNINFYDLVYNSAMYVQLKVGGVVTTSGYYSSSGTSGAESGTTGSFYMYSFPGRVANGVMTLTKASSSVWMETHASTLTYAECNGAGRLTGAGAIDGLRFGNTGTFSAGQVSVSYR